MMVVIRAARSPMGTKERAMKAPELKKMVVHSETFLVGPCEVKKIRPRARLVRGEKRFSYSNFLCRKVFKNSRLAKNWHVSRDGPVDGGHWTYLRTWTVACDRAVAWTG